MASLWRGYLALLARRPLQTKCVTSGIIMVAGDAIQQAIEYRGKMQDHAAATSAAAAAATAAAESATAAAASASAAALDCGPDGCALPPRRVRPSIRAVAPLPSFTESYDIPRSFRSGLFGALAVGPIFHVWFARLERMFPGSSFRPVAKKMLVDQGFMAPVFTVFYFASMGLLEGKSVDQIKAKITHATGPTLLANYCIFPFSQFVNFMFVPQSLQVLVLNAGGLVYNVYLSKYNAASAESEQQQEQETPVLATRPIATAAETAAAASRKK